MNNTAGSSANVQAIERNGVNYVPLASIVQQLGGTISWDNDAKKANLSVRGRTAEVDLIDQFVTVDGQERTLNSTPFVEEGRLYVTPDFLDELGLTHT
ncbi:MAG: copper amine oxidase N-terminal domain-containing protein [Fimbriimonas sp.]